MTERTWSSAQVCYATGASYRQVDNWIRCGYFMLSDNAAFPGQGHPRRFTFHDALQVAVMADLTATGIHPRNIDVAKIIAEDSYSGPYRRDYTTTIQVNVAAIATHLRETLGEL